MTRLQYHQRGVGRASLLIPTGKVVEADIAPKPALPKSITQPRLSSCSAAKVNRNPREYPLARATLVLDSKVPPELWEFERPVHFVLVPADTPDPRHPERLLADTGGNVLSYEVFVQGVRA